MKLIKKTALCLLAVLLFAAAAVPVLAAGARVSSDVITISTEAAASTEAPAVTEAPAGETAAATEGSGAVKSGYKITILPYDGEGKPLSGGGFLSCLGGGITFFIRHAYSLSAVYYDSNGKTYDTSDRLILGVEGATDTVRVEGNKVFMDPSDKEYSFTIRLYDPTSETGEVKQRIDVTKYKLELSDILIAAVALYLLVSAVRGKGSLFNDEFIKEAKKDQFKKLMRLICIVIGIVFLVSALLSILFSYLDWVPVARYVLFGVGLAGLITMVIINNLFTDKEKRAKAYQGGGGGSSHNSSAAFEFDEDEPTLDEVLENIEKEKEHSESSDKN